MLPQEGGGGEGQTMLGLQLNCKNAKNTMKYVRGMTKSVRFRCAE